MKEIDENLFCCIQSTLKTIWIIYSTKLYLNLSERGKYSTVIDDLDNVKIKHFVKPGNMKTTIESVLFR